jgi:hypothetical protein
MLYKKINLELIVPAEEAEEVVANLDAALDLMEDRYTLFGGSTESVLIEYTGVRRKSALSHSTAAGKTAIGAVKTAKVHVVAALRLVV